MVIGGAMRPQGQARDLRAADATQRGLDMIRNTIVIPCALFVAGAVPICVVLVYAAAMAAMLQ